MEEEVHLIESHEKYTRAKNLGSRFILLLSFSHFSSHHQHQEMLSPSSLLMHSLQVVVNVNPFYILISSCSSLSARVIRSPGREERDV